MKDEKFSQINYNLKDNTPLYSKNLETEVANLVGDEEGLAGIGTLTNSVVNKLHLIKVFNGLPFSDIDLSKFDPIKKYTSYTDLCLSQASNSQNFDIDDFLYLKNVGYPINHMITLRRFPAACTDNLWDKTTQGEPDIARMVTYFDQETNKLDELLQMSYGLRWREIVSEMEEATMQGETQGLTGNIGKIMEFVDPVMWKNNLRGDNANNLDARYDQNKVYGPVDSVNATHIRDVGFDYTKEFDIQFDYELRSINGRTPEYVFRDILANVLAVTYNNGKFWPGSRYWVGKRPSSFLQNFQWMNSDNIDKVLFESINGIKSLISSFVGNGKQSSIETLKKVMTGAAYMALGKMLDKLGRPGIITTNSMMSGEPTGNWHLTIGNPMNPILSIGNLMCTGVDISFPTDNLSYAEFPTKMSFKVKLKPAQAKDRAAIEMLFNAGAHRLYYAPKKVKVEKNAVLNSTGRNFFGFNEAGVDRMLGETYDFIARGTKVTTETIKTEVAQISETNTAQIDQASTASLNEIEKVGQKLQTSQMDGRYG